MIYLIKTTVSSIALVLNISHSMINGVIKTESNFDTKAVNKITKAYGLMQLKPSTEKWVQNHKKLGLQVKIVSILAYTPFVEESVQKHIVTASVYLKYLQTKKIDTNKTLFAYNNGPNKKYNTVSKYAYKVNVNKEDWYVAKL